MDPETKKNVNHTGNKPAKDPDLGTVCTNVSGKWKTNSQITLIWASSEAYEANAKAFNALLSNRNSSGGGRKEVTGKLASLDKAINEGASAIKDYLAYKCGKTDAPIYYPQFGIEKTGRNFIVPRDRDKRSLALPLIVDAIVQHGFDKEKYGSAFWLATKESYDVLYKQASSIDGLVSQQVGDKNQLRRNLLKTNAALLLVLRANYPDTFKTVIREWGFQKDKY